MRWDNPFQLSAQPHEPQWHDDEIGVAGCVMSLVRAIREDTDPSYGAQQARLDQQIILAIHQSASEGGKPIALPLEVDETHP